MHNYLFEFYDDCETEEVLEFKNDFKIPEVQNNRGKHFLKQKRIVVNL